MEPAARGRAAGRARVGGVRRRGRRPTRVPGAAASTTAGNTLGSRLPRVARAETAGGRRTSTTSTRCSHRAADDLRALYVEVDGEQVISAGIPWYSTVFGRDCGDHVAADPAAQPRDRDGHAALPRAPPGQPRGSVHGGAAGQDPARAPSRARWRGPARSRTCRTTAASTRRRSGSSCCTRPGAGPATPRWCGSCCRTPSARSTWIDRYGDQDGDGFVEYARTSARGLVNQGWKDSGDGVPFPDGRLPEPPIALVEVQGYVYDAKLRMAELFRHVGQAERAAKLRREAAALQEPRSAPRSGSRSSASSRWRSTARSAPIPTATSNAGHLLWSRVPTPEVARRLASRLLEPDFFSGWGVRTLSARARGLQPDELSQRLDLAARQRHRGARHGPARACAGGAADRARVVTRRGCTPSSSGCRSSIAGWRGRRGARPVRLSGELLAPGVGVGLALHAAAGAARDLPRGASRASSTSVTRCCPISSASSPSRGLAIGGSRVALQFRRHGTRTLANLLSVEGEPLQVRIELS